MCLLLVLFLRRLADMLLGTAGVCNYQNICDFINFWFELL